MRVAWAVSRATNALCIVGEVKVDRNAVVVDFNAAALEGFGTGELRQFVVLGPSAMREWPALPPGMIEFRPTTKLWANLRSKLAEHRPLTWVGWPMRVGAHGLEVADIGRGDPLPDVVLAVLRPMVRPDKLVAHEPRMDGFLTAYREGAAPVVVRDEPPRPRGEEYDDGGTVEQGPGDRGEAGAEAPRERDAQREARVDGPVPGGHGERVGHGRGGGRGTRARGAEPDQRGDAAQLSLLDRRPEEAREDPRVDGDERGDDLARADRAGDVRGYPRCAICHDDQPVLPQHWSGAPACRRGHHLGTTRVPAWTVQACGPSPETLRVRALTTAGLRFVRPGMVFVAERCPEYPRTDVWITCPEGDSRGISYRLNRGEWEPLPVQRRARSLDE